MRIPIEVLDAGLDLPGYAYAGDAGLDLRSAIDATIEPFQRLLIPTGIALSIPEGYAGFVLPRSGLAIRKGLSLVNAPGLIDSNYRGEIKVIAINLDPAQAIAVERNERIAQLVIMAVPKVDLVVEGALDESVRGTGGFGSSGS